MEKLPETRNPTAIILANPKKITKSFPILFKLIPEETIIELDIKKTIAAVP